MILQYLIKNLWFTNPTKSSITIFNNSLSLTHSVSDNNIGKNHREGTFFTTSGWETASA
jgi:hypothetical protein